MTTKCVLYAFISVRIHKIAETENASKFGVRNLGVYPLAPPRGAANPRLISSEKPPARKEANTLTQFEYPAQPVLKKNCRPDRT